MEGSSDILINLALHHNKPIALQWIPCGVLAYVTCVVVPSQFMAMHINQNAKDIQDATVNMISKGKEDLQVSMELTVLWLFLLAGILYELMDFLLCQV